MPGPADPKGLRLAVATIELSVASWIVRGSDSQIVQCHGIEIQLGPVVGSSHLISEACGRLVLSLPKNRG